MNINFKKNTLSVAIALTLVSCGGGGAGGSGGGISGIGGSGFISSGSVTGFGSVFVNGVEFETGATTLFNIEGNTGSQASLVEGMRVNVTGTINADGTTGTATQIDFEDQLEGPVSSAITEDADQENKTFTVLGVTVSVNAVDTIFVGTGFDYASLATADNIQISGFFDANGTLQATAVVKKNAFVAGTTLIEAKGTISALSANTFTLTIGVATLTVDANAADVSQAGTLANGQVVEVTGTITSAAATSISATRIKTVDNTPEANADIEIEGIITRFVSNSDFDVDGTKVDASSATTIPAAVTLRTGLKVEVEGPINNNVLLAKTLKQREGNVRVHATASNVNTTNNTFDLTVSGHPITVTANTSTRFEDKVTGNPFSLETLGNVDTQFLRVRGIQDGNRIIATRIRIETPDDVILQATLDSQIVGTSVTVLGVEVPIDGSTDFQNITNTSFPNQQADFFDATTDGMSLIKIKDKLAGSNPVGIADDVELQQP